MDETGVTRNFLSGDEVAFVCSAIGVAPRQLAAARKGLTEQYDLGPRGAWIIGLVAAGVDSPSALADEFRIGRSLVTTELNRLMDAGLVVARKGAKDGRRLELALTELGRAANAKLLEDLALFFADRLGNYTRDEVMFCARMLRELSGGAQQFFRPREEQ